MDIRPVSANVLSEVDESRPSTGQIILYVLLGLAILALIIFLITSAVRSKQFNSNQLEPSFSMYPYTENIGYGRSLSAIGLPRYSDPTYIAI